MSNAVQLPDQDSVADQPESSPAPSQSSRATDVLRSGWIPAALLLVVATWLLLRYDTPALDLLKYAAYLAFGLVLPGTLVWRALRGTPRSFLEDIVMGTALGYALEVPVYLATMALGVPALTIAWPAVVIVLFLAVPSLRRHWRPTGTPRISTGIAWTLAGIIAVMLFWLTAIFFMPNALSGEGARFPYFDMPFQLALAGELKNHLPPQIPYVVDEPLSYHWFVHAHMAASSTVTGIELPVILFRLFLFPMVVAGVLGIAILGMRVAKRQWAGPATVVVAYFIATLSPYLWMYWGYNEIRGFSSRLWGSPTQTFGTMLATPAVLLIIDRLRREDGPSKGQWALIAIFVGLLTGAKATYLPVLIAGLALVLAIGLVIRRKLDRVALIAAVITAVAFAFATFVLFGGASQGLVFDPLRTTTQLPAVASTQLLRGTQGPPLWAAFGLAVLMVTSWLVRTVGVVGLVRGRERLLDPVLGFLGGMYLAAVCVAVLFTHPGSSQFYFLISAVPFVAALSVWGVAAMIPPERSTWRLRAGLIGLAVGAALVLYVLMRIDGDVAPTPATMGGRPAAFLELVKPFAVLTVLTALAAGVAWWLWRRRGLHGGIAAAAVVSIVLGFGLATPALEGIRVAKEARAADFAYAPKPDKGRPIAVGGIAAATWLRDHSDPDDLVATNTHCRLTYLDNCDNRHFWISAYSERRVLVEGWGYTVTALAAVEVGKTPFYYIKYWDPDLLAENDRAFKQPSAETVGVLRDKHGVKWLFVDERFDTPAANLGDFATLRYRKGDSAVYELKR